jgi:hypothetical protein
MEECEISWSIEMTATVVLIHPLLANTVNRAFHAAPKLKFVDLNHRD